MSNMNDPIRDDLNRGLDPAGRRLRDREGWGTGSIILASLAALAIVFGLFYAMSNRGDTSLANRDRPAVTTTTTAPAPARETTGSGNTPGGASTTPAPAFPAPANR